MTEILDVTGAPIETKKKPIVSRAERRRMMRDPNARNKIIAGTQGVPEYYQLMAYGQLLVHDMSEIQLRMLGIPKARGRRPHGQREALQETLVKQWDETVEKLEAIQTRMTELEAEMKKEQEAPNLIEVPKDEKK